MYIALVIMTGIAAFLLGFFVGATASALTNHAEEEAAKLKAGVAPVPIVGPSGKVIGSVVPPS